MEPKTITRKDLANALVEECSFYKINAKIIVDLVIEEMINALVKEGRLKITNLGSFNVTNKSQRIGRNPKTNEEATISARKVVTFRPALKLRKEIEDGYQKHFMKY